MQFKVSHEAAGRAARRHRMTSAFAGAGLVIALFAAMPAQAAPVDPKPIGGGTQISSGGPLVHYFPLLPARQGMEFSSIFDFNGILGAAHVENMGTLTDKATGAKSRYPFKTDVRFMQGKYVAVDGVEYEGTFALVFLRIQSSPGGPDIHCVSVGVSPGGLVSTLDVNPAGLFVDSSTDSTILQIKNTPMSDYVSLNSALTNGPSQDAMVKYLIIKWLKPTSSYAFSDGNLFFRGTYSETKALGEFQYETSTFIYKTDPLKTSRDDVAVLGSEFNGLFW